MAENMNVTAVAAQVAVNQVRPQTQNADPAPRVEESSSRASQSAAAQTVASAEELQSAIDQLNQFMNDGQRSLAFSVDKEADEVVVQVRDKQTNELVRQIPTPEALQLKEHLQGVIGLLFNDKV